MTELTMTLKDLQAIARLTATADLKDTSGKMNRVHVMTFAENLIAYSTNRYTLARLDLNSPVFSDSGNIRFSISGAMAKFILSHKLPKRRNHYQSETEAKLTFNDTQLTVSVLGASYTDDAPNEYAFVDRLANLISGWLPSTEHVVTSYDLTMFTNIAKIAPEITYWTMINGLRTEGNKPVPTKLSAFNGDHEYTILQQPSAR
jgi:hypothetical protein